MTLALPVRIVGCGSPFGDDALGWAVAEAVRTALGEDAAGISVHRVAAPHHLLDLLDGQGSLVVVDALAGAGTPGTVVRFDWPDPRLVRAARPASAHGLGLADCLDLAERLGRLPRHVVVFGIACTMAGEPSGELAGPAAAAVEDAVRAIVGLLPCADARPCAAGAPGGGVQRMPAAR